LWTHQIGLVLTYMKSRSDLLKDGCPDYLGESLASSGIRVIARAADILKMLGQHPEGMTLREIANSVNLPRSTVQRIVKALDDANFVIAASPTSGVRLGPALTLLAGSARQVDLEDVFQPLLDQLNRDCGETIDLSVFGNDKMVVVSQAPGIQHGLVWSTAVGSTLPLHASAPGKALLAEFAPHELGALRKRYRLVKFTENTITDWQMLEAELSDIRHSGVAYDTEECFNGIRAVGKIVHAAKGDFCAVSIPTPAERFEATKDHIVRVLQRRCEAQQRRAAQ
jgi:IclR family transcriptional regulator, acetate operon repressor